MFLHLLGSGTSLCYDYRCQSLNVYIPYLLGTLQIFIAEMRHHWMHMFICAILQFLLDILNHSRDMTNNLLSNALATNYGPIEFCE